MDFYVIRVQLKLQYLREGKIKANTSCLFFQLSWKFIATETELNVCGQKQRLTSDFADVREVRAAAVAGVTVLVASAAGDLVVKRLVTVIPARREGNDRTWKATRHVFNFK